MLRYGILGPVTVHQHETALAVGGARQRRLLAALLVHRNHALSDDALVEIVFAGAPPPRAAATLRTYVSRLRTVLGAPVGAALERVGIGYRLSVADDALDAALFEDEAVRARRRLVYGDATGALPQLQQALGRWRGDALEEFVDEPWAQPESRRLEASRNDAREALLDAQLACGNPGEVVAELERLLVADPWRDGFHERLAVGLYRTGRAVDALDALRRHRRRLADELGLDPSPQLLDLEAGILAHDESLLATPVTGRPLRGWVLRERLGVGRAGTIFTGRRTGSTEDVIVRVYPAILADEPEFIRRFEGDARRVASLDHEAVVTILDAWREPGAAAVVTPRMTGGTLADRLAMDDLSADNRVTTIDRIVAALDACARRGVSHGNLGPHSILFDSDGFAHLGDFALGGVPAPLGDDVDGFATIVGALGFSMAAIPKAGAGGHHETGEHRLRAVVEAVAADVTGRQSRRRGNPYVGLRPFDLGDSDRFYGRDAIVGSLVERIEAGHAMTLVVGGSGTGKSSVVRAGLVPAMPPDWVATVLTPGATPFKELRAALERVGSNHDVPTAGQLRTDSAAAAAWLTDAIDPKTRMLLVVDQFEEVFTLTSADERAGFLHALVALVDIGPVAIVATLRADYFARSLAHPTFGPLVAESTVPLSPMGPADLAAAITGPSSHLDVEAGLVAHLVDAVVDRPGALPALQFTLYQLAEHVDGTMTQSDLDELGGVEGAIAWRAEQLYTSATPLEQAVVRPVFEALVQVEATSGAGRRRTTRAELVEIAQSPDVVTAMVQRWVDARLLVTDRDPETRDPTVEVAHEALLERWPRLRDWIDADRDWLRTLAGLRRQAASWADLDQDPGALLRGATLDRALEGVAAHPATVAVGVGALVDASRVQRDEERSREADVVAQRERTTRTLRRQRRTLAVALVAALVVGVIAVERQVAASRNAGAADARARSAITGVLAAADEALQSDWPLSLLLAVEAFNLDDSDLTRRGLLNVLTSPRPVPRTIHEGDAGFQVVAPDGDTVVLKTVEGTVEVRDATDGELRFPPFAAPTMDRFNGMAVSDELIAASGQPTAGSGVVVHDAATGARLFDVPADTGESVEVAFSPTGDRLAVTGQGRVRIVDVASRATTELPTGSEQQVVSVTWGDDGRRLYGGGFDGALWAWELADSADGSPAPIPDPPITTELPLPGPSPIVAMVSVGDGDRLAVATFDAGVFLLDAATLRVVEGPLLDGPVTGLAVAPDGSRMAVAAFNRVPIWGLRVDGRSEREVTLVADAVDVALGPDGFLVTAGLGGQVVEWELDPLSPVMEPIEGAGPGIPTVSPDGQTLSMAGFGAGVRLFDLPSRQPRATLALDDPATTSMGGVAFVPGADRVVTTRCPHADPATQGPCEGVVETWSTRTGERVAGPADAGPLSPWIYAAVAVSDDGDLVALGRHDRLVEVRDTDSLDLVAILDALDTGEGFVTMLDFSSTAVGELVATTGDAVATWDVRDPTFPLRATAGPVGITAAFTPDDLVVTSSQEGSVALRDPTTFEVIVDVTGLQYPVYRPTFTTDGALMASVDDFEATVRLWRMDELGLLAGPIPGPGGVIDPSGEGLLVGFDPVAWIPLDPELWIEAACEAAGRNLTATEWSDFLGDEPRSATCPEHPLE